VRGVYSRREAVAAGLFGVAMMAMVWGPAILRFFSPAYAVDLQALRLPDDRESVHVRRSSPTVRAAKAKPGSRVDINHADAATLQTLPGIGSALAHQIISHRQAYGPFDDTRGLLKVNGIGLKRLGKMESWIEVR